MSVWLQAKVCECGLDLRQRLYTGSVWDALHSCSNSTQYYINAKPLAFKTNERSVIVMHVLTDLF